MTPHRALAPLVLLLALATPAFAVNKDMVQLQTQVQNLQDSVARLQQTNDERMGVLKDLVQQTADSINKMSVAVGTLQQQMRTQQEASGAKIDQVSGQMQSLNDSVDEVKARLNNLDKALQALQGQQQSINAALQNMQPPAPAPADPNAPPSAPSPDGQQPMADNSKPSAGIPFRTTQGPYAGQQPQQPAAPAAAPVADLYRTAYGDYIAAKNSLAASEFQDLIRAYPNDNLAGNAWFYLGEMDFHSGKFSAAVKDYDHVLGDYPSNQKIAVAHLHKGQALLSLKQRDAAVDEFRALIQRFPNSPEATQARSRLNGMGVSITARRPT
jgi:TolA-binding protein